MHKSRLQPTVPYSYTHNDTLTAERTLVTHTNAQLSTCLHRLNRCRSLGEVGLCSRNICPPNPPIYIPHRLQGRGAVQLCMLWDFFFFAKGILLRPLTSSHWLKPELLRFLRLPYSPPAYAAPIFRFSVSLSCLHDPAGSQLGLE